MPIATLRRRLRIGTPALAFLLCLSAWGLAGCAGQARKPSPTGSAPSEAAAQPTGARQFTFSWPYATGDAMAPRGGTSKGPPVELERSPSPEWQALQEPGLAKLEKDRRAILAMAGTFRASFDFLEVAGFRSADFQPDRPYQSWGTEYVFVVHDEPHHIALQHILVMFLLDKEGAVRGPFVTKHWRQDWRYEDRELLSYRGLLTWERERLSPQQAKGTWTQAVYQVDDSPRYEAYGRWEHFGNVSSWLSSTTWRPLPRREFSVRKDYQVLVGTNQVTLTPTGWIHQEDNLKVELAAPGVPAARDPVVAEELGLNRYERLRDFDDSAARRYAERTQPFWNEVRAAWDDLAARGRITMRAAPDQAQLFVPLFEYAGKLDDGAPFEPSDARAFARKAVRDYLRDGAPPSAAPRR